MPLAKNTTTQRDAPLSVLRVIRILEHLASNPDGYTLTDLSEKLETPKSSLVNLLRGLAAARYVENSDHVYTLGSESFRLGTAIAGQRSFLPIARPIMQRLTEQTGETALLATLTPDNQSVVYIHKSETKDLIRFSVNVGEPRPLHSTGSGRVLMAYQTEPMIKSMLRNLVMTPLTRNTITSKAALRKNLKEVKRQGYSVTLGETSASVGAVAAPVFGDSSVLIASLTIVCPVERAANYRDELVPLVVQAAREISGAMGYREEE
ncbi:IclR family transcriptional regulator [Parahaliea maris]|uniref:HTH-type transcriptional repressor AllR n=1 Tax=Parahaliea maris TaxID=2716870 RepID=A0A5C8ZMV6_9GAMM|nr:IclR family transcriptional regulator [Parahaliea maris]TXS89836.1 IclR family transcriptional regulator [Parahaliea maris]